MNCFWAENGGGGRKKVKKKQKKTKKRTKSGKNEQKAKKWYVFVQKSVQNCTPDSKTSFNVKMGSFERAELGASYFLTG